MLLKDVEKSFTGITESLSSLRSKLESLPSGVLIIGSHTQMDSRKEKVRALFLRNYIFDCEGLKFWWYCFILVPACLLEYNRTRINFTLQNCEFFVGISPFYPSLIFTNYLTSSSCTFLLRCCCDLSCRHILEVFFLRSLPVAVRHFLTFSR